MRTIPGTLAGRVAASSVLWGECLVLQAVDGTRVGFTTLDEPQTIDLGLGAGDDICDGGMTLSAITLAVGLDASFAEVRGPLGPVLTRAAVEGGRWDDAEAWLVRVSPGAAGIVWVLAGWVRETRVEGIEFVLEIRNAADWLNQELGETVSPFCKVKEFGDAQCGYPVADVPASVTAVTDDLRFSVSLAGPFANDYFNLGKVTFTSGALAGIVGRTFDWISTGAGGGDIVLDAPLPEAPAIGDNLNLRQGCARTRAACMGYGNMVNFRGVPDAPGSVQALIGKAG